MIKAYEEDRKKKNKIVKNLQIYSKAHRSTGYRTSQHGQVYVSDEEPLSQSGSPPTLREGAAARGRASILHPGRGRYETGGREQFLTLQATDFDSTRGFG